MAESPAPEAAVKCDCCGRRVKEPTVLVVSAENVSRFNLCARCCEKQEGIMETDKLLAWLTKPRRGRARRRG